jgi:hypothetical protein
MFRILEYVVKQGGDHGFVVHLHADEDAATCRGG